MTTETKLEKFRRLAVPRFERAAKDLELLENLGRSAYEVDRKIALAGIRRLAAGLEVVSKALTGQPAGFSLSEAAVTKDRTPIAPSDREVIRRALLKLDKRSPAAREIRSVVLGWSPPADKPEPAFDPDDDLVDELVD